LDVGLLSKIDGNYAYWMKKRGLVIRTGVDSKGNPKISLVDKENNEAIADFSNPLQAKIEIRNMFEDDLREKHG